jgi:DNA-binding transcriptional regulator PaaX
MCMPDQFHAGFKNDVEGNVHLELALLVACGYDMQEVRVSMIKLAKEGMLVGYRRSGRSANYETQLENIRVS